MDIFGIEIGKKIAKIRKEKKFNQDYLAHLINKSRASLTNIENGKQGVTLKNLYNIAIALDIEVSELLPSKEWYGKNKNKKIRIIKTVEFYED